MSCGPEPADNMAKALDRVARGGEARARTLSACPSFSRRNISASAKTRTLFDLAEPIPGPAHREACRGRGKNKVVLVASLFEKRAPGVYHNTAAIFDSDGALRGIYRKMHIPDDPLYYEKFYFTPGDLGYKAFDTECRENRHAGLLGPVVSGRRAADCAARREHSLLSDGDRLASGMRRPSSASRSTMHGVRSSAPMRSPMAFM